MKWRSTVALAALGVVIASVAFLKPDITHGQKPYFGVAAAYLLTAVFSTVAQFTLDGALDTRHALVVALLTASVVAIEHLLSPVVSETGPMLVQTTVVFLSSYLIGLFAAALAFAFGVNTSARGDLLTAGILSVPVAIAVRARVSTGIGFTAGGEVVLHAIVVCLGLVVGLPVYLHGRAVGDKPFWPPLV